MTSKIKEARLEAGFSRAELHRLTGIPVRTIENWDSGTNKPPEWTERLVVNEIKRLGANKARGVRTMKK
ncbi:MAG: helix-turn-helix transcriptional regulator [Anaerovoracaceae bacterium]